MNPLLLLGILGGGYVLFGNKKKTVTSSKGVITPPSPEQYEKLAEKGYYFVNCNSVVVKDEKKAFDYVYKVGKNVNPFIWDGLLFDGCVNNIIKDNQSDIVGGKTIEFKKFINIKDPKQALFVFNLVRYLVLALVETNQMTENEGIQMLEAFKKSASENVDTKNWDTSLPKQPIPQPPIEPNPKQEQPNQELIKIVTDDDFEKFVLNSTGTILVEIWADWCGVCTTLPPVLEKLVKEHTLGVAKINYDENKKVSEFYNIKVLPTFLLFNDGIYVGRREGFESYDDLVKFIDTNLNKKTKGFIFECGILKTTDVKQRNESLAKIQINVAQKLGITAENYLDTSIIDYSKELMSIINPNCIKNPKDMNLDEKALYFLMTIFNFMVIPDAILLKLDTDEKLNEWKDRIEDNRLVLKNYLLIKDSEIPTLLEIEKIIGQTGSYP